MLELVPEWIDSVREEDRPGLSADRDGLRSVDRALDSAASRCEGLCHLERTRDRARGNLERLRLERLRLDAVSLRHRGRALRAMHRAERTPREKLAASGGRHRYPSPRASGAHDCVREPGAQSALHGDAVGVRQLDVEEPVLVEPHRHTPPPERRSFPRLRVLVEPELHRHRHFRADAPRGLRNELPVVRDRVAGSVVRARRRKRRSGAGRRKHRVYLHGYSSILEIGMILLSANVPRILTLPVPRSPPSVQVQIPYVVSSGV